MITAQGQKHTLLFSAGSTTNTMANGITNTAQTANLDCLGADYATIVLIYNVETTATAVDNTVSILESDDTTASNFATITADIVANRDTTGKLVVYHVDTRTRKRYLRIINKTGTTSNSDGIVLTGVGITGRLIATPASTSTMIGNTSSDQVVIV